MGRISGCYNNSTIKSISSISRGSSTISQALSGGITGFSGEKAIVENCYNSGSISTYGYVESCGGILSVVANNAKIENSYNYGLITIRNGDVYRGGIAGRNGAGDPVTYGTISNSYCTEQTKYSYYIFQTKVGKTTGRISENALKNSASTLGDAFTDDIQNEDGTWKYNDGYPILKWQLDV